MSGKARLRCAIYTRKSSDEGLDQAFNSLDAQREAGEAYVKSQASEGWRASAACYDDGGYSGGSMERPGLQRLMADVDAGLIDVVVVYKIDRLTRSLADFARIVERFDARGVSFVSVTQAFNTTTSMSRGTRMKPISFKRHRFPPDVIRQAVWLCFRLTLSLRDVEARQDVFDYIEMFYNPKRKHVRNGMLSPVEFERQ